MLTDTKKLIDTKVLQRVAGHNAVQTTLNVTIDMPPTPTRTVLGYQTLNWANLNRALRNTDWTTIVELGSIDVMVETFTPTLLDRINAHVPTTTAPVERNWFAWVSQRCKDAFSRDARLSGEALATAQRESKIILADE